MLSYFNMNIYIYKIFKLRRSEILAVLYYSSNCFSYLKSIRYTCQYIFQTFIKIDHNHFDIKRIKGIFVIIASVNSFKKEFIS
jgi:hypothetical protein